METFDRAWEYTLENEGGYCNEPNDKGGATKYGISLRFLKGLTLLEGDINNDGKIDQKDIDELTLAKAKQIYKSNFWNPLNCAKIEDSRVAIKVFDAAVNFGVRAAATLLQKVVNIEQDGIIGPTTLEVVNATNPAFILTRLVNLCEERYRSIVSSNPTMGVFIKGWLRRARKLPQ